MSGWVYVMSNGTPRGLVKIGRTEMDPQERARQLSAPSGVPAEFEVLFAANVGDAEGLEKALHVVFRGRRPNDRREFFWFHSQREMKLLETLLMDVPAKGRVRHPELDHWMGELPA